MTGRGLKGRRRAEALLIVAFALIGLEACLFVAAPGNMGPDILQSPQRWILLVPAIGILGQAGGLAWMIRIYRATLDPEAHRSVWRWHRR